jgi:hypothetical protein
MNSYISTYKFLGITELGKGGHTIGPNSTSSKESDLKIRLPSRSFGSDKGSVITSSGRQEASLEKEPLQNWNGVGLSENSKFGCDTDPLLRRLEGHDSSRVILKIFSYVGVIVNHRDAMVLQMFGRSNATAHEQLRRTNGTIANQDFTTGLQIRIELLDREGRYKNAIHVER